jgi:hypothetical protein
MSCSIDTESTDDDGDAISYTFEWDVDGEAFTDTETTTETGDTVPDDSVGSNETWTCTVTPDDGEDEGSAGEATTTTGPASIPAACVEGSTGSVDYLMCPTRDHTWEDAQTRCEEMGFDGLASILNASEQAFLEALMPETLSGSYYWIGLNDREAEGEYYWADGTSLGTYTNWRSGSPYSDGSSDETRCLGDPTSTMCGTENCIGWAAGAGSYLTGLWADQACAIEQSYICEAR